MGVHTDDMYCIIFQLGKNDTMLLVFLLVTKELRKYKVRSKICLLNQPSDTLTKQWHTSHLNAHTACKINDWGGGILSLKEINHELQITPVHYRLHSL